MRFDRRWFAAASFIVGAVAVGCGGLSPEVVTRMRDMSHRSDSSMIAHLDAEAASFDSLVTMLASDRQIRDVMLGFGDGLHVYDGGDFGKLLEPGQGGPGLPPERVAAYARLLRRIGIHYRVTNEPGRVELLQEVEKIGGPGIRRGYLWTATPPERGLTNEDLMSDAFWTDAKIERMATHYRPLRDGWHLFTTSGYSD